MASPKLITKPKYGMILFLLAGALMFFFFAYSVISAPKSGELVAYSIWWLLSGCFLAFAATCVFHALRVGKVYRENGEIVFYSFLGFPIRQITPNDIVSFTEEEKVYEYRTFQELRIFTEKGKFKVWSYYYDNYYALRRHLTKRVKRDHFREEANVRRSNRNVSLFIVAFGLFLISIPTYQYFSAEDNVFAAELTTISGTIHDLKVDLDQADQASLTVYLQEYPGLSFPFPKRGLSKDRIGQAALKLRRNAPVALSVKTTDYRQKITGEESPNLFRWPGSHNDITVYSANDDQYRYFLLAEYNSEANETSALWFLTLFGLIFTGVGVYEYPRRSVRK